MMATLRVAAFTMFIGIFVWKVNALGVSSVSRYEGKPLVDQRFSINDNRSNENVVPREVVNHVRHKHEQTIGNIHISTNIDIANTITILNTSAAATSQSSNATVLTLLVPGTGPAKDADSRQRDPASINGQQFGRPIRNQGDEYPLVFPKTSFIPENSRNVRFPTERHSVHAIDSVASAAAVNPIRSIIVFPRSDTESENELATHENTEMEPVVSIAMQTTGTNEPLPSNTVNMSAFVVNETAIENGFEPMVYIDDDGVFRVKYVTKGENVSASSAKQQHSNEQSLASINKTEETAIISNDNRQILQDHRVPTNKGHSTTIDLVQSNATINNTELNGANTKGTSSGVEPQQKHQPKPSSARKHPREFNGQLIFV